MENTNNSELFDLGSEDVNVDFDPFAEDDNDTDTVTETEIDTIAETEADTADDTDEAAATNTSQKSESAVTEPAAQEPVKETPAKKTEAKDADAVGFADKPPVFEYAGATENIDDGSKTFDELRIEKSADFPELEDGKRVSWTMEYGKITRAVPDPKGTSIGKMKTDLETSKEFEDSLKKRGVDKNPTCKIKPRVTAQSKGQATAYKGVFTTTEEAEVSGKVISIVPGKDGRVYEIRNNVIGRFTTPVVGCELLSNVRAGFNPALPLIPMDMMMRIVSFFRYYMRNGNEQEVLVNVYWDKHNREFAVDAPEQTVTKASVESVENLDFADERYIHYMDIHSHNSMKAFFSTVDDKDEQATRLYSVIGRLDKYYPDIKTRISNGGKFLEIDPGEVFEYVARPFPDEWKSKVRFRTQHEDTFGVDRHEILS